MRSPATWYHRRRTTLAPATAWALKPQFSVLDGLGVGVYPRRADVKSGEFKGFLTNGFVSTANNSNNSSVRLPKKITKEYLEVNKFRRKSETSIYNLGFLILLVRSIITETYTDFLFVVLSFFLYVCGVCVTWPLCRSRKLTIEKSESSRKN